jgi:hypothetical protein
MPCISNRIYGKYIQKFKPKSRRPHGTLTNRERVNSEWNHKDKLCEDVDLNFVVKEKSHWLNFVNTIINLCGVREMQDLGWLSEYDLTKERSVPCNRLGYLIS